MRKKFRVLKNFKIVNRFCSLNRYYRVCKLNLHFIYQYTNMELLPLESMLVIMVLVTMPRVFLTDVRPHKLTMLLPLLDMVLKVENPIGWSRIPGVTTGEMAATSRLREENQNVVLVEIAHWWNVQRQELLHQPHKLHLPPLFQQVKLVT